MMILLHAFRQSFADAHVCNINERLLRTRQGESIPVNRRFVYSKPQASFTCSFSFEIMLASASSDADTPWIRRFLSIGVECLEHVLLLKILENNHL
jgi:predicted lipid carrier protein YhbT